MGEGAGFLRPNQTEGRLRRGAVLASQILEGSDLVQQLLMASSALEPVEVPAASAFRCFLRPGNRGRRWDSEGRNGTMHRNKHKEQFQFSQGTWHQTPEDTVVPATVSTETGAISEHQPHWRKVLTQMTTSQLHPRFPQASPLLWSQQGSGGLSLLSREQGKLG